ncbi:HNH endonuclease [Halomonas sp. AOP22-C1-8]|uniref:HNH endonuclease n=1 Tax=Halomonas sp. AOP22-C1-8 TaxID=3457717 RepID=UPI004034BCBB
MKYYWVNQAKFVPEAGQGIIQADVNSDDHARKRILEVESGDIIFSFTPNGLGAILIAEENVRTNASLCIVKCDYNHLESSISIPSVVESLSGHLGNLYSPINVNGTRNQGYLYPLNDAAGIILLDMAGFTLDSLTAGDNGNSVPGRKSVLISRVVRDTKVSREIKKLYSHVCQVCNTPLETLSGAYAEGAHIIPLGKPHDGSDIASNILCLCPNHHVLFDSFSFSISDSGDLIGLEGVLHLKQGHSISNESLKWHREQHNKALQRINR